MEKKISELEIGDLFSFKRKSAVYMVTNNLHGHFEYKSFNDGKIRIQTSDKTIFTRKEMDTLFEKKWFKGL